MCCSFLGPRSIPGWLVDWQRGVDVSQRRPFSPSSDGARTDEHVDFVLSWRWRRDRSLCWIRSEAAGRRMTGRRSTSVGQVGSCCIRAGQARHDWSTGDVLMCDDMRGRRCIDRSHGWDHHECLWQTSRFFRTLSQGIHMRDCPESRDQEASKDWQRAQDGHKSS